MSSTRFFFAPRVGWARAPRLARSLLSAKAQYAKMGNLRKSCVMAHSMSLPACAFYDTRLMSPLIGTIWAGIRPLALEVR